MTEPIGLKPTDWGGGGVLHSLSNGPDKANDGNFATYFIVDSPVAGSTYWQVDLGAHTALSSFRCWQATGTQYATTMTLQGSDDLLSGFTDILTFTPTYRTEFSHNDPYDGYLFIVTLPLFPSYRYWRLRADVLHDSQWALRWVDATVPPSSPVSSRLLVLCSRFNPYWWSGADPGSWFGYDAAEDVILELVRVPTELSYGTPSVLHATEGFGSLMRNDLMLDGAGRQWCPPSLRLTAGSFTRRYFARPNFPGHFYDLGVYSDASGGFYYPTDLHSVCEGPSGSSSVWLIAGSNANTFVSGPQVHYWDGSSAGTDPSTYMVFTRHGGGTAYAEHGFMFVRAEANDHSLVMDAAHQDGLRYINDVYEPSSWPCIGWVDCKWFKIGGQLYALASGLGAGNLSDPRTYCAGILKPSGTDFTSMDSFTGTGRVAHLMHYVPDLTPYITTWASGSMGGPLPGQVLQFGAHTVISLQKQTVVNSTNVSPVPESSLDLNWVYTFDGATLTPILTLTHGISGELYAYSGGIYHHKETDTFWAYELTTNATQIFVRLWKAPGSNPAALTEQPRFEIALTTGGGWYTMLEGYMTANETDIFITPGRTVYPNVDYGTVILRYNIAGGSWHRYDLRQMLDDYKSMAVRKYGVI